MISGMNSSHTAPHQAPEPDRLAVERDPASYSRDSLTRITVTIPTSLLADVDRLAGRGGRSRYIAEAAVQRIRRDVLVSGLDGTHGMLADEPALATTDLVDRWVDRVRSDPRR
jgi:hypothetical protein